MVTFERVTNVSLSLLVYPPLAEMADDDKGNWKPGQKKKKSERVDATWNPKSKNSINSDVTLRHVGLGFETSLVAND